MSSMRTRFRRNEVGEDEPILPNTADEQLDESHLPSYGSLDSNYEELPTTSGTQRSIMIWKSNSLLLYFNFWLCTF